MTIEKNNTAPEAAKESPTDKLDHEVDALLNYTGNVQQQHDEMGEELYELAQDALGQVRGETQAELAELRNSMLHQEASSEK